MSLRAVPSRPSSVWGSGWYPGSQVTAGNCGRGGDHVVDRLQPPANHPPADTDRRQQRRAGGDEDHSHQVFDRGVHPGQRGPDGEVVSAVDFLDQGAVRHRAVGCRQGYDFADGIVELLGGNRGTFRERRGIVRIAVELPCNERAVRSIHHPCVLVKAAIPLFACRIGRVVYRVLTRSHAGVGWRALVLVRPFLAVVGEPLDALVDLVDQRGARRLHRHRAEHGNRDEEDDGNGDGETRADAHGWPRLW